MYFQIGMLVLIGLGAKNAVLRVTFAVELRKQGLSIMDATIQAGEERLRPILMTSLAFIFGVLPLAVAMGAGANARHSIGTGIIGGMIGETTLAMLYVPLFFYLFDRLESRLRNERRGFPKGSTAESPRISADKPVAETPRGALTCADFAAVLLAVLLAGCAVGPDYRRPDADIPESFRYSEADARDTANTAWWRQFGDPVLDGLVDNALANNKNVRSRRRTSSRPRRSSPRPARPCSRRRLRRGGRAEPGQRDRLPRALQLRPQPADEPFRLRGRIVGDRPLGPHPAADRGRPGEPARDRGGPAGRDPFPGRLGGGELHPAPRPGRAAVDREAHALNAYGESLRLFELKHKYGQVSRMNVEQARTQYETAAAAIPEIESQIVQTENALSLLLGRNPGPIPRGRALDEIALPAVPAAIPAEVLERRPDIAQSEQDLVAANAQIGAARALYFPTISLTGSLRAGELRTLRPVQGGLPARGATPGRSPGRSSPPGRSPARSGRPRRRSGRRSSRTSPRSRTPSPTWKTRWSRGRRLAEQVKAQERLVAAASEYTRLAQLQYDGGYSPYTTVIQAQEQLFPAELNLVKYRASLFTSFVGIYKALGGGWVEEPTPDGGKR